MDVENPPAFPRDERFLGHNGMTLRDWFAGQALAGFMASTNRPTTIARDDAEWCYIVADAMLAARNAGGL
jgi:hypothetical protein